MKPATEPAYPTAALEPGEAGATAEAAWFNDMIAWGRGEHGKVKRLCDWTQTMGAKFKTPLPKGWCQ